MEAGAVAFVADHVPAAASRRQARADGPACGRRPVDPCGGPAQFGADVVAPPQRADLRVHARAAEGVVAEQARAPADAVGRGWLREPQPRVQVEVATAAAREQVLEHVGRRRDHGRERDVQHARVAARPGQVQRQPVQVAVARGQAGVFVAGVGVVERGREPAVAQRQLAGPQAQAMLATVQPGVAEGGAGQVAVMRLQRGAGLCLGHQRQQQRKAEQVARAGHGEAPAGRVRGQG